MAKNPMQRRANTSFLLGMLITLLVAALIIGFLVVQLVNSKKEIEALQTSKRTVLVLNQSVTSGQTITTDMLDSKSVDSSVVPENAFADTNMLLDYSLEDEYGNSLRTTQTTKEVQIVNGNRQEFDELYIIMSEEDRNGNISNNLYKIREVTEDKVLQNGEEYNKYYKYNNPEFAYDEADVVNGYVYVNDQLEAVEQIEGRYYTRHLNEQPGERYQTTSSGGRYYVQVNNTTAEVQQDGDQYFFMNGSTRVNLIKVGTENVDQSITNGQNVSLEVKFYAVQDNSEKTEWVIAQTPLIAKVSLTEKTVMTNSLVTKTTERVTKDLRRQEYNIIALPSQIQTGEYIDIRLRLPDGTDYIVVSHKEVEIPTISGIDTINNIIVQLSEDEILLMSNAIVESYMMPGSLLYATRYVEPGLQDSATPTYVPSNDVLALFNERNSNITQIALRELQERYTNANAEAAANIRNNINSEIEKTEEDDRIDAVIEGTDEELVRIQEERQLYIDSLSNQ